MLNRIAIAAVVFVGFVCTGFDGSVMGTSVVTATAALTGQNLKGDVQCPFGAADCNRCASNVQWQLESVIWNDYANNNRIRFSGYAYPMSDYLLQRMSSGSYEHVQGIGRLAGIGNDEYMVFTHSTDSGNSGKQGALAVVRMGANRQTSGYTFGGMPNGSGSDQNTSNRTVARTYSRNNHPGGLSVLGHHVFVAQWCQNHGNYAWCRHPSMASYGFSVYDVSSAVQNATINSNPPIERHYRNVHNESWIGTSSTAGIAAAKLKDGSYLVALSRSGGRQYGFYTSSSISGPYTFRNASKDGDMYWGENGNIVTECGTGDLYLFQMEGYETSSDYVHLYKFVSRNSQIGFEYVTSRKFICRGASIDGASDWCHFDAGTGVYVNPSGNIILYATDWQQSSFGNIRLVEFW